MTMKFHGTRDQLRTLFEARGIHGVWESKPNSCFIMRHWRGANIHWAEGSKTVWIDGRPDAAKSLRRKVEAALGDDVKMIKLRVPISTKTTIGAFIEAAPRRHRQ